MKKYLHSLYLAIKRAIVLDGIEHAGYMAFMVMLSLFPFLVFFLSLTSFLGASDLGKDFIEVIIDQSPEYAAASLRLRFEELKRAPPNGLLNLAIIGTIWTASSFLECLRTILNRIFGIKSPPPYIFRRLLSILQFLAICLCLVVIMTVFVLMPSLASSLHFPKVDILKNFSSNAKFVYVFVCMFFCVLSFYTFIPNAKLSWTKMIPGAIFTTIAWQISGRLLSSYILYFNQFSLVYGSLGSIMITLIFLYIINFIFIVGAALNYHLSIYETRMTDK
ncbi:MAG: YihY/virulence factor BrkB family protein [Rickettsiaceae bacterium]|nr:YihY/virulence factor BrkB family protein [Rickettsiaceae bacterium]